MWSARSRRAALASPALRPYTADVPAISRGVTSFIWAVVFAVYILFGGIAVGFSSADSFVVALVAGAAIFLYVRIYGEDSPGR